MLVGIYINIEDGLDQYFNGNELFIVLFGLIIVMCGFFYMISKEGLK